MGYNQRNTITLFLEYLIAISFRFFNISSTGYKTEERLSDIKATYILKFNILALNN